MTRIGQVGSLSVNVDWGHDPGNFVVSIEQNEGLGEHNGSVWIDSSEFAVLQELLALARERALSANPPEALTP